MAHFCDKNSRISTFVLGELFDVSQGFFVFVFALLVSVFERFFGIGSSNDGVGSDMTTGNDFDSV